MRIRHSGGLPLVGEFDPVGVGGKSGKQKPESDNDTRHTWGRPPITCHLCYTGISL